MSKKIHRSSAAAQAATPSATDPHSIAAIDGEEDESRAIDLPEEIIVHEILLRLGIKSLFVFKCVAKRYKFIISHPNFGRKYMRGANSSLESYSRSGLVASMLVPYTNLSYESKILSTRVKDLSDIVNSGGGGGGDDDDDQLSIRVSRVSLPTNEEHEILASSNGLILCILDRNSCEARLFDYKLPRYALHVSNPLTKQCVLVPECEGEGTLSSPRDLVLGMATRPVQQQQRSGASFLTYKVVLIRWGCDVEVLYGKRNIEVEIFSSDTGRWVALEPTGWKRGVSLFGSGRVGLSYKGVLHWLSQKTGTITTYDPYNRPDRFGRIRLPNQKDLRHRFSGSLVQSGEGEMLSYCQVGIDRGEGVPRVSLWRLLPNSAAGKIEWCMQGKYMVPSLTTPLCWFLLVAPNPWNRNVLCHPMLVDQPVTILNPRAGRMKLFHVFTGTRRPHHYYHRANIYQDPLIPIELCPWSSPFYQAQA